MTVASDGPYVFSIVRSPVAKRSTSSDGQGSPPTLMRRTVGKASSSVASSVGTMCRTLTRCEVRNELRSEPTRLPSLGLATSAAPDAQVGQISSTEKSNEIGIP